MPTAAEKDLYQKQLAATNAATLKTNQLTGSNIAQLPSTISSSDLAESPVINVPPAQQPTNYATAGNSATDALLKQVEALTTQGDQQNDFISSLSKEILGTQDVLNTEAARKGQLETEQGIGTQRKDIQAGINRLKQLQAEQLALPMEIQEEFKGTGATAGGVAPIQAGRQRQLAIEQLRTSAVVQAQLGNLEVAQQNIQDILKAEFEPERQKLERQKLLYDMNKDVLERIDKRRAEALNIALNERTRVLGIEEADKKEIYEVGKIAGQYGADSATVEKIFSAKTREEALALAGKYMQDPKAKYELENARLSNILTQAQITRVQRETSLIGQKTEKEVKEAAAAITSAKESIPVMQDKITLAKALKNHAGLRGSVGPYGIARFTPFSPDKGERVEFIGSVENLLSGLTLDNLIAAKARGATFGALSEGELNILAQSASSINNWALKDDNGKVYGYEVGETAFKAALDEVVRLTSRALEKSTGQVFAEDEVDLLNQAFNSGSETTTASSFYGI